MTRGRSALYEELTLGVAADLGILSFLETLPMLKRQPNLLFAAVRHVCGTPRDFTEFRRFLFDRLDAVTATMIERRTQTNEPARCATLLPLLAQLPGPLALLEVGAAAGLCLLPDRYAYDYDRRAIAGATFAGVEPPVFACAVDATTPLPKGNIEVVWRAGLDVDPIDVNDSEQVRWLETLVWPHQNARLDLLRRALAVARVQPPRIVRGDLRSDLTALASEAPSNATLVIFHSAVLAYIDMDGRRKFAETVRQLNATWISNEHAEIFPDILAKTETRRPDDTFLMARDGEPVAWADMHGTTLSWL